MLAFDDFVSARAELCRRLTATRAARFGREIHGSTFDDDDMGEVGQDPSAPPVAFHIIYSDARGELSGRCVTVRSVKAEIADARITAYCHLRNRMRTFLASRVVEVTDLATGEVDDDGLGFFLRYPLLKHMTADDLSAMSPELIAIQECRDEIIVLSMVAACDGRFDEDEQDEIVKHVLNRFPDEEITERGVRGKVASWIPDERAFEHAFDRLCAGHGDAVALMSSLRRVVDSDRRLESEEFKFAAEVESRLQLAGRIV